MILRLQRFVQLPDLSEEGLVAADSQRPGYMPRQHLSRSVDVRLALLTRRNFQRADALLVPRALCS